MEQTVIAILMLVTQALTPAVSAASANRDRVISWNASNPLFQPTGENVLLVNMQDRITFECPSDGTEYYQIYWTTNPEHARLCAGGSVLFNCRKMNPYVVLVQIFPADPTAPGFLNPVYFYSPSTGDLLGLDQTAGGACLDRNMRVTVRTGDPPTTPSRQTGSSGTSRPPDSTGRPATSPSPDRPLSTATDKIAPSSGRTTATAAAEAPVSRATDGPGRTTVTSERDPERVDFARINLITGSAVAMPTLALVASLACLAVASCSAVVL